MANRSTMQSRHVSSILKDANKQSLTHRRDTYGNEITHRGKHRIKFKKEMHQVIFGMDCS